MHNELPRSFHSARTASMRVIRQDGFNSSKDLFTQRKGCRRIIYGNVANNVFECC